MLTPRGVRVLVGYVDIRRAQRRKESGSILNDIYVLKTLIPRVLSITDISCSQHHRPKET